MLMCDGFHEANFTSSKRTNMKTKKLLTILTLVSVILITGCKKDDFTEINVECPSVELTDPANGATGVPVNLGISVTFNEIMNPASCDTIDPFTIKGATPVAGTVSYNEKTATFTPSENLLAGTTYTASISTKFKNHSGIPLAKKYEWSFTTVDGNSSNIATAGDIQVKEIKL